MALAPGTRIGKYEIVCSLGAGGMGEVYRARDARLRREVAIKLMLQDVAADAEHLARFEREAQTLAALNHPNIAQIYGIEEAEGSLALIIELVEGPTLFDRIQAGLVSYEQAIAAALQLAEALEYAHALGVIHRDLKPANVKLRPDGTVKVLDFGLAKRLAAGRDPHDDTGKFVASLTQPGTVFGTPAYMAPEVLRGGIADARSDIFAFGVILFELLTGKHPFERSSIFEIAEAILNPAPPEWPATPMHAPDAVKMVVYRALAKDATQRYQTIGDVKRDLMQATGMAATRSSTPSATLGSDALATFRPPTSASQSGLPAYPSAPPSWVPPATASPASVAPSVAVPPARRTFTVPMIASVAAIALAIGAMVWQFAGRDDAPTGPAADAKHTQVTFRGNVRGIAFSPDGRTAAFASTGETDGHVMVQDVTGGRELEIWKGDLVVEIQWMPDGSNVIVSGIQNNQLGVWVVPRLGGAARRLPVRGAHISVSPDGQHLALAMQNNPGFRIAPISGGAVREIKMAGFQWLLGLDWGAKSNRIAVLTQAEDGTSTVWTIAPDGSDKRRVHTDKSLASIRWSPIDEVIYAIRPTNEVAEIIRMADREANGEPEVILTGLPYDSADPYQRQASLSTDGRRLLFVRGYAHANLWRLPLGSAPVPAQVTQGTSRYGRPRISPDGKWIASSVGTALKSSIVRIPMAGGEAVPVTSGDSADSNPAWSRDGKQVAFLSVRADVPRIWVIDPEVRSATEVKDSVAETQGEVAIDWLADGRLLWTVPGSQNYAVRDVRSGAQEMLLPPPAKKEEQHGWLNDVRVSPDGKQLAVWWNRPIGDEDDGLWMIEWPSRQFRKLLPGDFYPAGWSPDSQSIYAYEYLGRRMMKISASTGKAQDIGAFPLGALEGCDISPDAKTAICTVRQTQSDAWLIENFDPKIAANPQK